VRDLGCPNKKEKEKERERERETNEDTGRQELREGERETM
jgi:hypothetical protein